MSIFGGLKPPKPPPLRTAPVCTCTFGCNILQFCAIFIEIQLNTSYIYLNLIIHMHYQPKTMVELTGILHFTKRRRFTSNGIFFAVTFICFFFYYKIPIKTFVACSIGMRQTSNWRILCENLKKGTVDLWQISFREDKPQMYFLSVM